MHSIYAGNCGAYIKDYLSAHYSNNEISKIFESLSYSKSIVFRNRKKTIDSFFRDAGELTPRNILLFDKISSWVLEDINRQLEFERNIARQNKLLDVYQSLKSEFASEFAKLKKACEELPNQQIFLNLVSDGGNYMITPKIAVITALEEEFLAVEQSLDNIISEPHNPAIKFSYTLGEIQSNSGKNYKIVLVKTNMGNNLAAVKATRVFAAFPSIETVVMCGIAGGVPCPAVPKRHVRLGDVVYSDWNGIRQFDMKVLDEITDNKRNADPSFIEAVDSLSIGLAKSFKQFDEDIEAVCSRLKIKRPDANTDVLIDYEGNKVKHPRLRDGRAGKPRIFGGAIASSNELLKDPRLRDKLGKECAAKAVEMEAAGVADACYEHKKGCFVVRGISDYCDKGKTKIWQPYAAAAAAAYLKNCIKFLIL